MARPSLMHLRSGEEQYVVLSLPALDLRVLTPAERAVARLVMRGKRNRDIARARRVSVRTVANQLASIFKKLEVGSRAELTAFGVGPMKGDPVAVIEAAYAVDAPVTQWLDGLLEKLAPCLDEGLGVWGALYDASPACPFSFEHVVQRGMSPEHAEVIQAGAASVTREQVDRTFRSQTCGTLSQLLGPAFIKSHPVAVMVRDTFGIHDSLGINAQDPTLKGCVLGVPFARQAQPSARVREVWSRVAAHIAAGHRLRRDLEAGAHGLMDGAEAVLAPDGALKHAANDARSRDARSALRAAAVALDKVRARQLRRDGARAVDGWKALVSGRWSLVDHFERDGRRYVVARRNDPRLSGEVLTLRERQVAGFTALGHSNKLIGYELGLDAATVASHLSSAMRKLKVKSRAELIRAYLLTEPTREPPLAMPR